MNVDDMIDSMRAMVLTVLPDGTIEQARGGFGGFLGIDVAQIPGTNVFSFVPPDEADELALYFLDGVDESDETLATPLPFRVSVINVHGEVHPVDILPTGHRGDDGQVTWTVVLIPVSLHSSVTRSLELEMSGATRDDVRKMLCEELRVDNENYTSRWLLIDLVDPMAPRVCAARPDDQVVVDAVTAELADAVWRPWEGVEAGTSAAIDVTAFPEQLRVTLATKGWGRSIIAPVDVNGRMSAALLLVGSVPDSFDPMCLKAIVAAQISNLVRATKMLLERWEDQDRLLLAAATDHLTNLMNRREFLARLESERRSGALLYIDVDDFKRINDGYGHTAGDDALVQISRRIESVCRPQDAVCRMGGDEFVVLLPGADETFAQRVAERIVERIAEPMDVGLGFELAISVSTGTAALDADDPLDAADQAMLASKRRREQRADRSAAAVSAAV